MNNPLGVSPSKGKQGTTRSRQRKNLLTSVGIEPTTSALDLPLICRLSYKVAHSLSVQLILCSTLCVSSATRHNVRVCPYFLFAAIHHLKSAQSAE